MTGISSSAVVHLKLSSLTQQEEAETAAPTIVDDQIRLWRAVIAQAFMDACSEIRPWMTERRPEEAMAVLDARNYLTGYTDDFYTVCGLAGLNPNKVREEALKLKSMGWPNPESPKFMRERPKPHWPWFKCATCGVDFQRRPGQANAAKRLYKNRFCSKSCQGRWQWRK